MIKRFFSISVIILILIFPIVLAEDIPGFDNNEGEGEQDTIPGFDNNEGEGEQDDDGITIDTNNGEVEQNDLEQVGITAEDDGDTFNTGTQTTDVTFDGTVSPGYTWNTPLGSFSDFQLTDALFSLGALSQASLTSFEDNNNLFFGSLFDDSTFQMILNDQDEALITQRNSLGDMGRVYVEMAGGNLTQDGAVLFVPNGDHPSYTYHDNTGVEFKDGTVYYYNEAITNSDDTDGTSMLNFDENGFTRVEIQPDNNYTYNHYTFRNTGRDSIYGCKDDASCDINIDISDNEIDIQNKAQLYYDNELILDSFDSGNQIEYNEELSTLTLTNSNPRNGDTLIILNNDHHTITETRYGIYDQPRSHTYPSLITQYTSESKATTLSLVYGSLSYGNYLSYIPNTIAYERCEQEREEEPYCSAEDVSQDNQVTGNVAKGRFFSWF